MENDGKNTVDQGRRWLWSVPRGTSAEETFDAGIASEPAGEVIQPLAQHLIQPLAQRAMFMRPFHLCDSAWLEHIPFAFWLVEAHRPRVFVELGTRRGASYFAFCQAVERLGVDARCFAVDRWTADEHAGSCDEGVFEEVRNYNTALYSHFSSLVRSSFDEAAELFSEGAIDLLHIDGPPTLRSVRHDFETWLPKLSDRAVVLLHGSNVRERRSGVYKLFEELRELYPSFEFACGHGLGVLGVGPHQEGPLLHLFEARTDALTRRTLHNVFGRLGRACADAYAADRAQAALSALRAEVARKDREHGAGEEAEAKTASEIARLENEVRGLSGDLSDRDAELATLKGLLHEAEELSRLRQHEAEAARIEAAAEKAAREAAETQAASEVKQLKGEVLGLRGDLTTRDAELAKLARLLREAEDASRLLQRAVDAAREQAAFEKYSREKAETRAVIDVEQLNGEMLGLRHDLARVLREAEAARGEVAIEKAAREASETRAATKITHLGDEVLRLRRTVEEARRLRQRDAVAARQAFWNMLGRAIWAAGGYTAKNPPGRLGLRKLSRRLRDAGIVDADWYLRRNDDVAKAGINPVAHFIRNGFAEGRSPIDLSKWMIQEGEATSTSRSADAKASNK